MDYKVDAKVETPTGLIAINFELFRRTNNKVWVMFFIRTSEVEIYNSREDAYRAAKEYIKQLSPEYAAKSFAALEKSYNEGEEYFCVGDIMRVDPHDILVVLDTEEKSNLIQQQNSNFKKKL